MPTNCLGAYCVPGDDDDVLVAVTEHYEIIDPELPYEKRFHTDHIALSVSTGDFHKEWEVMPQHLHGTSGAVP